MSRRSPRSPRTRDDIARDLAIILNSDVSIFLMKRICAGCCWGWTEIDGKYRGCRYATPDALSAIEAHRGQPGRVRGLIHEHAVPRIVIAGKLLALQRPTTEDVAAVLDRYAIGVVVTQAENKRLEAGLRQKMPPTFTDPAHPHHNDPFARYRATAIPVIDTRTGSRVV